MSELVFSWHCHSRGTPRRPQLTQWLSTELRTAPVFRSRALGPVLLASPREHCPFPCVSARPLPFVIAHAHARAPAPAAARPPRVHSPPPAPAAARALADALRFQYTKMPARFILTKSSAARAYHRVAWSIGKSILDRRIGVSSNPARDVCAFFLASRCWAKLELRPGGFGEDHLLRPHPARAGEHNLA